MDSRARLPLELFAVGSLALALATPAAGFSATVSGGFNGIDFAGASPTVVPSRPDAANGVTVFSAGGDGLGTASGSFNEIYEGQDPGTGQSVSWRVDGSGFASLGSGTLRAEALAHDDRNAGANTWDFLIVSEYSDTLTFSGPATAGFYEVTFNYSLDPFDADPNPVAPSFVWEARAITGIDLTPASGAAFGDLNPFDISTFLDDGCPSFSAGPPDCDPFFGYTLPPFERSATVFIPESNPVLDLTHSLTLRVTSAHADVSNTARLGIELAPGVSFDSESALFLQSVPEPSMLALFVAGLAPILRGRRSSASSELRG